MPYRNLVLYSVGQHETLTSGPQEPWWKRVTFQGAVWRLDINLKAISWVWDLYSAEEMSHNARFPHLRSGVWLRNTSAYSLFFTALLFSLSKMLSGSGPPWPLLWFSGLCY